MRSNIGTTCGPVEGEAVPPPSFDLDGIYHNSYTVAPHACVNVLCQPGTSTNVFICSDVRIQIFSDHIYVTVEIYRGANMSIATSQTQR